MKRRLDEALRPAILTLFCLGLAGIARGQNVIEYPIPTANCGPGFIAAGPDGALWFTESNGNKIGRINTAGAITEFAIPTFPSNPGGIAADPDGALWFVDARNMLSIREEGTDQLLDRMRSDSV